MDQNAVVRAYDAARDREAAHRIWLEIGWLDKDKTAMMDPYVECGRALVAELNGEAECLVITAPGVMRHLDEDLSCSCVTGVTTSRVARKLGLASRVTARVLAEDRAAGALVAQLGMFEQGYYTRLGFGTGPYEHHVSFDPALITVSASPRVPVRLSIEDAAAMYRCRLARMRGHGGINVLPPAIARGELEEDDNGFGLGYRDEAGELTHYVWCFPREGEHGPYSASLVYRTREGFLELMGLLRSLGDQVRSVRIHEPAHVLLQDVVKQPFRHQRVTKGSKFEARTSADAYWQLRILDLAACLERTHLLGPGCRFNLDLTDPIERFLEPESGWRGLSGEYVVSAGPESGCAPGSDASLPTLKTTVSAFSRLWIGAISATGLSLTDHLEAPDSLIMALDRAFCLPVPRPDWDF